MHLSLTLSVSLTGPVVYKRYILDLMAGMCQKVKWKKSSLAKEDCTCSPARERRELILAVVCIVAAALFSVVANQYGTERWRKALGVMDIVLNKNPTYVLESIIGDAGGWREQPGPKGGLLFVSTVDIGRSEHINVAERLAEFGRGSRTWQSADKGKALVSNCLYQASHLMAWRCGRTFGLALTSPRPCSAP